MGRKRKTTDEMEEDGEDDGRSSLSKDKQKTGGDNNKPYGAT